MLKKISSMLFAVLLIGTEMSFADVFKNISGSIKNHTKIPSQNLKIKVYWFTASRFTFDGCKGWSEESVTVSVDVNGRFLLPKIGSNSYSPCKKSFKVMILTPDNIEIPNVNAESLLGDPSRQRIERIFSKIQLVKTPDLFFEFRDTQGNLIPTADLVESRARILSNCSDGTYQLVDCEPYDDFFGDIEVKKNPGMSIGNMISWSESDFKFFELGTDVGVNNYQQKVRFPVFPIQEKISIQWTVEK